MMPEWNTLTRRSALVAAVVVGVAAAFLAGRASVAEATRATAATVDGTGPAAVWTVRMESVGRSLNFSGRITPTTTSGPIARAAGVITSVSVRRPQTIQAGAELYAVELRPVVAGAGAVPAFRDLTVGVRGADVKQLRDFLCGRGQRSACGDSLNFDTKVAAAVAAWQRSVGAPADGVVRAGDILWFPSLPIMVRPTEQLETGRTAAPGDRPYLLDAGTPNLELRVSRDQAALIPVNAVAVVGENQAATIAGLSPAGAPAGTDAAAGGEFLVRLTAPASADPFCAAGDYCLRLLGDQQSVTVQISVQTVPEQTGTAVPVAAIETDAGGSASVRLAGGGRLPVSVVVAAGGVAVVTGLNVGDQVMLPQP